MQEHGWFGELSSFCRCFITSCDFFFFFSVEVTIYVQAFSDKNPIFAPPWTPSRPQLEVVVREEQEPGTVVFSVTAKDPVTGMILIFF